MTGTQLLNIVNGAINLFVENFALRVQRAEARQWFRCNLRNGLLKDPQLARPISANEIASLLGAETIAELPTWMRDAAALGRTLHWFEPDNLMSWKQGDSLVEAMHNLVDWFNSLPDDDRRWRSIDRISVDDAVAAALAWHRLLAKRLAQERPEDWRELHSVMSLDDGVEVVRLGSKENLVREGLMMGHCVANYAPKVESGACRIFSVRDRLNRPHVTIEVASGHVVQVRGRGNAAPNQKWLSRTVEFVRAQGWSTSEWAGLPTYRGRVFVDRADMLANIEALIPTTAVAFDHTQVLNVIQCALSLEPYRGGLSAKEQDALVEALGVAARACGGYRAIRTEQPALDLPGAPIDEVQIDVAATAFVLAEMGLFPEAIPRVVELCGEIGRSVLTLISASPGSLFRLSVGCRAKNRGAVSRFFASAGLAEEFWRVRCAARAFKRRRAMDGGVAMRRRLADRRMIDRIAESERNKAMNAIRVQIPHFCEKTLRAPDVI